VETEQAIRTIVEAVRAGGEVSTFLRKAIRVVDRSPAACISAIIQATGIAISDLNREELFGDLLQIVTQFEIRSKDNHGFASPGIINPHRADALEIRKRALELEGLLASNNFVARDPWIRGLGLKKRLRFLADRIEAMPLLRRESDELSSEIKVKFHQPNVGPFNALAGHQLPSIYTKHFGVSPSRSQPSRSKQGYDPYVYFALATCAVFNIGADDKRLTDRGSKMPAAETILRALQSERCGTP
jgi:hypothetical protein